MLSSGKANPTPLHLRNASTDDPVKKPYKIPTTLQGSENTGYFVLQYKIAELTAEEHLQLETGYKVDGMNATAISQKEEQQLLAKLKLAMETLEKTLKKGDEQGYRFIAPLANDAFLFKSSKSLNDLKKIDNVYFVDVFHPAFKLTSSLYDKLTNPKKTAKNDNKTQIALQLFLFPDADTKAIEKLAKDVNGKCEIFEQIGFVQGRQTREKVAGVVVPESAIADVADLADVHLVEEASIPGMKLQHAHGNTGVNAAIATMAGLATAPPALNGAGQTIGLYDSGVDNGAVGGNLVADLHAVPARVTGDTAGWVGPAAVSWADRWYDGTAGPVGFTGHGTFGAGIMVGDGNLSGGNHCGVAPAASVYVRPFAADFNAAWPVAPMVFDLTTALTNAYAQGARIHNNSWGETAGPDLNNLVFFLNDYRVTDRQVENYTRANPQMLVVAAAGNDGPGANTVGSPGVSKNILTVGASGNGNPTAANPAIAATPANAIAGFSSRGPVPVNRLKPDVVAPGDKLAAVVRAIDNPSAASPVGNTNYEYVPGTSFAAPYVSGMAALVRQFLANNTFHNGIGLIGTRPNPSGMLVKAFIINGAQRIGAAHIPNNDEGYGLVNLNRSIDPARLRLVYDSFDAADPNNAGAAFSLARWFDTEKTFALNGLTGAAISITLVWNDLVDGASTGALVCDLDLILRNNATGHIYRGGVASFNNSQSRLLNTQALKRNAQLRDNTNSVEKIYVTAPAAGDYTLRVKVRHIPGVGFLETGHRVPFAVVVAEG